MSGGCHPGDHCTERWHGRVLERARCHWPPRERYWGEGGYVRIERGHNYQRYESDEIMCAMMHPTWADYSAPVCRVVAKELTADSVTLRVPPRCWFFNPELVEIS